MNSIFRRTEYLQVALIFCFFATLFFSLTVPVSDPDFWWHLSSGKWIWTNGSLVHGDPFTIDSPMKEVSASSEFILKQYWLAQLIFYASYAVAGFKGIIFLSSLVFTLMFYFCYRLMINEGVGRAVAAALVFLSVMVVVKEFSYIGTKPQMWSSLFSVLIVYLLESLKRGERWSRIAIPLLMMLWANMHGGFVLGNVIIILYCIGTLFSRSVGRGFYVVAVVSILLSGLNPNGYMAFISAPFIAPLISLLNIESLQRIKEAASTINELQSIFQHASIPGIVRGLPYFSTIFVLSILSLILNIVFSRSFRAEHLLLYAMVFFMGLSSIRFIIFFALIASYITAINLKGIWDRFIKDRYAIPRSLPVALVLVVSLLASGRFVYAGINNSALDSDRFFISPFERVADFMQANKLKGNLFNDYNAGGYLIWRVAPDIKLFIDGRGLYGKIFEAYRAIIDYPLDNNNYILGFPYFNIDMVMVPGCDKVSGTLIKLAVVMLENPDWSLIYDDEEALLFIKNKPENEAIVRKLARPKSRGYNNIYGLATISRSGHAAKMPNWKLAVAVAHEGVGENVEALRWMDEYLQASPEDAFAIKVRARIASKIGRH